VCLDNDDTPAESDSCMWLFQVTVWGRRAVRLWGKPWRAWTREACWRRSGNAHVQWITGSSGSLFFSHFFSRFFNQTNRIISTCSDDEGEPEDEGEDATDDDASDGGSEDDEEDGGVVKENGRTRKDDSPAKPPSPVRRHEIPPPPALSLTSKQVTGSCVSGCDLVSALRQRSRPSSAAPRQRGSFSWERWGRACSSR